MRPVSHVCRAFRRFDLADVREFVPKKWTPSQGKIEAQNGGATRLFFEKQGQWLELFTEGAK
jgi:hypothetical protein